jgi:hypothetical protein
MEEESRGVEGQRRNGKLGERNGGRDGVAPLVGEREEKEVWWTSSLSNWSPDVTLFS